MMINKKISVIVPIYNTNKELTRCLDSIINQTYKDLEIICIDDGSSDGSENILDEFAKKDSRIISIHQENKGESNARNKGLSLATGDYIAFVDCDDWLDLDMYEIMLNEAVRYDLDVIAGGWYKSTDRQDIAIRNNCVVNDGIFGRDEFLSYIYKRDSYRAFAYMWDKLYRREILHDESGEILKFDESLKLGGDVVFLAEAALNSRRIKYIDRAFYHYYQRNSSGCHTTDLPKMQQWVYSYEIIIDKFVQKDVPEDVIKYAKRFMVYHSCNALKMAIEQQDDYWKSYFRDVMKKNEKEYIELNKNKQERIEEFYKLMKLEK